MVKSRGNRVDLGEVEATMYAHPAVKEVAVVPIPDDLIGNRIAAFVSLKMGALRSGKTCWRTAPRGSPATWCPVPLNSAIRCRGIRMGRSIKSDSSKKWLPEGRELSHESASR